MPAVPPPREALRTFVGALYGGQDDARVELAHREAAHRRRGECRELLEARDLAGTARRIEELSESGREVFVGALPRTGRPVSAGRPALGPGRVVWAECEDAASRERLSSFRWPPHLVVETASSLQAYWRLGGALEPGSIEEANGRLATALGASDRALRADRLVRVPGTREWGTHPPRTVALARHERRAPHPPTRFLSDLPRGPGGLGASPPTYLAALAGVLVPPAGGRGRCPLPGCGAEGALYAGPTAAQGWRCDRCGRAGDVHDLAGELWGVPRGNRRSRAMRERIDSALQDPRPSPNGRPRASRALPRLVVDDVLGRLPAGTTAAGGAALLDRPGDELADLEDLELDELELPDVEELPPPEPAEPERPARPERPDWRARRRKLRRALQVARATAATKVAALGLGAKAALAALAVAALCALLLVLLMLVMIPRPCGEEEGTEEVGALNAQGIPANLVPIYLAAAVKYKLGPKGPAVLAAINKIETGFGSNRNVSSAGAQGWMQFMPATWRQFGVDADGDGRREVHNPRDAIFSAAHYLSKSGAPGDWRKAVFAYNHSDSYVAKVLADADRFQSSGTTTVATSSPAPSPAPAPASSGGKAKIIQGPRQGTHTLGNWQSDNAIDIGIPMRTPLTAVEDGVIAKTGGSPRTTGGRFAGANLTLKGQTNSFFYTHNWENKVKAGDRVKRGQVIALSGAANGVDHLHLGVQRGDPAKWADAAIGAGGPAPEAAPACGAPSAEVTGGPEGTKRVSGGGRIVDIPGFPGEQIDSRLLPDIAYLVRTYKIKVTDGYSTSREHSAKGEHPIGLGLDIVPGKGGSWEDIDRLANWAEPGQGKPRPPFRWVGYDGDANHGRGHHLHLSWDHGGERGPPASWVLVMDFE